MIENYLHSYYVNYVLFCILIHLRSVCVVSFALFVRVCLRLLSADDPIKPSIIDCWSRGVGATSNTTLIVTVRS